MFQWVGSIAASVGGRIALGFTAIIGMFWLLFDPSSLPTDWEKIVGVLGAIGVWLWSEIVSHKPDSHPDDLALLTKLRARFPDHERTFVREHSFGDSFHMRSIEGFVDFDREWTGAAYEFHDKKMQAALTKLKEAAGAFANHLAVSVRPLTGNPAFFTTSTVEDANRGERSVETYANIKQLNDEARRVSEALDQFERVAKGRLRT